MVKFSFFRKQFDFAPNYVYTCIHGYAKIWKFTIKDHDSFVRIKAPTQVNGKKQHPFHDQLERYKCLVGILKTQNFKMHFQFLVFMSEIQEEGTKGLAR